MTGVHIAYDTQQEHALFTAIKSTPGIGSIALQRHALARFRETIAQNINYSVTIYVTLAVIIAFGVVYNSARIQLSEHARELASLRVLGFTRAEVSRVLLTELVLLTLIAIPLGLGHRLRLRLATDPGVLQRPLPRAVRHRDARPTPRRVWSCLLATARVRPHRAPTCRQPRPHRGAEDQRLGADHALFLDLRIKRGLMSGWRRRVGLARCLGPWPKPVAVDVAEVGSRRPSGHRRRGGQDPHQGRLHGVGTHHRQAGAPVPGGWRSCQEGRDHGCHHRADGAGLP